MRRISEHIDYHARRIAQRAKDNIRKTPKRPLLVLLIAAAAVVLAVSYAYLHEAAVVQSQDMAHPLACARLRFPPNAARCGQALTAFYTSLHGLERDPVCDRAQDRTRFWDAASATALCAEYDEALAAQRYNATLQDRGISVWEPDDPVMANGTLHVRALDAISALTLICDGALLDTAWNATGADARGVSGEILLPGPLPQNSACIIIASTDAGSITSESFSVVATR